MTEAIVFVRKRGAIGIFERQTFPIKEILPGENICQAFIRQYGEQWELGRFCQLSMKDNPYFQAYQAELKG